MADKFLVCFLSKKVNYFKIRLSLIQEHYFVNHHNQCTLLKVIFHCLLKLKKNKNDKTLGHFLRLNNYINSIW